MQSALTDCMNNPNNVKGSISTSRKLAMCQEQTKRAFENAGGSTQKLVPTASKKISDPTKESNTNAEDIIEKFESRIDDLEEQIEELRQQDRPVELELHSEILRQLQQQQQMKGNPSPSLVGLSKHVDVLI